MQNLVGQYIRLWGLTIPTTPACPAAAEGDDTYDDPRSVWPAWIREDRTYQDSVDTLVKEIEARYAADSGFLVALADALKWFGYD